MTKNHVIQMYKEWKGESKNNMNNRVDRVKSFFAQPERYLKNNCNIRIRTEIVRGFVAENTFQSILDIGCGNGAISLPLLRKYNRLSLLDASSKMLSIAISQIPSELHDNVEAINEDFMRAELPSQSYDLILCLGVLAHVDSPAATIAKTISLVKPKGSIIVQNSDSRHPVSYFFNLYSALRSNLLRIPYKYTLSRLNDAQIMEMFGNQGLELVATYRYNLPIPGMARIFSNDSLYKFTRKIYGTHTNNYRSWLGAECIYHFTKPDSSNA